MSLYGGISFIDKQSSDALAKVEAEAAAAAATANGQTTSVNAASSSEAPKELGGTEAATKAKPMMWSSALRFAPVIRKKPAGSSTTTTLPSGFKVSLATAEESSNVIPGIGNKAIAPSSSKPLGGVKTISAPPTMYTNSNPLSTSSSGSRGNTVPATSTSTTRVGRVGLKPPPMTLDDGDINGFKQSAAGKRAASASNKKDKKKKNRKGTGAQREDPGLAFTNVPYEPSRPCDYSAYKAHLQALRMQRRLDREAERRRDKSLSGSSYYTDSEGERSDVENRPAKFARFAPPTSYNSPPREDERQEEEAGPSFTPAVSNVEPKAWAPPKEETGEEAYLRRLAMSQGGGAVAKVTAPEPSFPAGPPHYSAPPPTFHPAATSGSSYYAPPSFLTSGGGTPSTVGAPVTYEQQPSMRPPPTFTGPGITQTQSISFTSNPSSSHLATNHPAPSIQLSEAAAKAKEVAARLSKLAAFGGSSQSQQPLPNSGVSSDAGTATSTAATITTSVAASEDVQDDSRPFAEKMMAKFGWTAGKGLGADESGMTTALSIAKATANTAATKKKGKSDGNNYGNPGQVPLTGMAAAAKARGSVIDSTRESRLAAQTAYNGEPSRVVLLTNLCGRDDVDDDLNGEVAEEANKFGVVERCFVYMVPGENRDEEAVRIFLVMSGLAGGYNAVKTFDGRFFGGRTVRARFYDEAAFNSGRHTL